MAFNFVKSIGGVGRKLSKPILLANSQTVSVGDFIETFTTGKGVLLVAAKHALGSVVAIVDAKGMPIKQANPVAGTASGVDLQTVATGTGASTYVIVDISQDTVYSAQVNGTLGTTVSSTLRGCHINVDSANTDYGRVLESTATRTKGVEANFYSHGVDTKDSTRLLVSIAMSEMQALTT